jgi:hypothetical protein
MSVTAALTLRADADLSGAYVGACDAASGGCREAQRAQRVLTARKCRVDAEPAVDPGGELAELVLAGEPKHFRVRFPAPSRVVLTTSCDAAIGVCRVRARRRRGFWLYSAVCG